MKIALVQANPTVGAISRNSSLISRYYRSCQEQGARLVVFPELAVTGFPLQDLVLYRSFAAEAMEAVTKKLAPSPPGKTRPCSWGRLGLAAADCTTRRCCWKKAPQEWYAPSPWRQRAAVPP